MELEGVPGQVEELVFVHIGKAVLGQDLGGVADVLVFPVFVLAAALVYDRWIREISRQF